MLGNISRRRRASVVLPLEDGPDMPIMRDLGICDGSDECGCDCCIEDAATYLKSTLVGRRCTRVIIYDSD